MVRSALERSDYFEAVRLRSLGDTGESQNFQISLNFNPTPEQEQLRRRSDTEYGNEWCSGQIEASLRAVL